MLALRLDEDPGHLGKRVPDRRLDLVDAAFDAVGGELVDEHQLKDEDDRVRADVQGLQLR